MSVRASIVGHHDEKAMGPYLIYHDLLPTHRLTTHLDGRLFLPIHHMINARLGVSAEGRDRYVCG